MPTTDLSTSLVRTAVTAWSPEVARLLALLRMRLGLPQEVHSALVEPLVTRLASELASCEQGDTAIEARLRGMLGFAMRVVIARSGRVLPPNALPERVGELAHRWTYAVLVAAMLESARGDGVGSAAQLFESVVPEVGRAWLREEAALGLALNAVLRGEPEQGNPIAAILADVALTQGRSVLGADAAGDPRAEVRDAPSSARPASITSPEKQKKALKVGAQGMGQEFLGWLREGLASGSIGINSPESLVHGVPRGLLVLWPAGFRSFLEYRGEDGASGNALKLLRHAVLDLGAHLATPDGSGIHSYRWRDGMAPVRQLRGIVIDIGSGGLEQAPAINPGLERVDPVSARSP
jgi:hypothetical protein